jgi:hypothetical protein
MPDETDNDDGYAQPIRNPVDRFAYLPEPTNIEGLEVAWNSTPESM